MTKTKAAGRLPYIKVNVCILISGDGGGCGGYSLTLGCTVGSVICVAAPVINGEGFVFGFCPFVLTLVSVFVAIEFVLLTLTRLILDAATLPAEVALLIEIALTGNLLKPI